MEHYFIKQCPYLILLFKSDYVKIALLLLYQFNCTLSLAFPVEQTGRHFVLNWAAGNKGVYTHRMLYFCDNLIDWG